MPERGEFERMESFSNPMAPPEIMSDRGDDTDDHQPLSNADFRKMLMTPRAPKAGSSHSKAATIDRQNSNEANIDDEDDPAARRRKKKIYYAKLKRLEEEREKELAEKYRDRARERRDGQNTEYDQTESISTTADYRAVAPDAKSIENYAERRKQVIQNSKYLGGDMEHTHLVKGLDYALLEKVRAEISTKEREEEQEMEKVVTQAPKEKKEEEAEDLIQFKTKMGRNVYRSLFKAKEKNRNELFIPGRMAYVVDLEDEFADSDVPTTTIRSKADCPSLEATTTLTTNDIVINKLTQILSYLRQGRNSKKLKKLKGKLKEAEKLQAKLPGADDNIYADLAEYMPSVKSKEKRDRRDRDRDDRRDKDRDRDRRDRDRERHDRERDRERDREYERGRAGRDTDSRTDRKRKSYFEKPVDEDDDGGRTGQQNTSDLVKSINDRYRGYAEMEDDKERKAQKAEEERRQKLKQKIEIDSYAECYPGMEEAADAVEDSDDEVDYTKMDQGNKKGPVGRWDFDTQEEYSDYMANKEALPKAAFQYGVKMSDGRKTRRAGPKDEKAELDRQWQQIQNIMNKRKSDPYGGGGGKKAKY